MTKYHIAGVRRSDGVECNTVLDADSEAEALGKARNQGIFPTKIKELRVVIERVPSRAFREVDDTKSTPDQPSSRPIQTCGSLLLITGLLCIATFGLFYDTTVTTTSGGYLGIPSRSETVHNIGKQQNRLLGFIGGIAAAGTGFLLIALDMNQNAPKEES